MSGDFTALLKKCNRRGELPSVGPHSVAAGGGQALATLRCGRARANHLPHAAIASSAALEGRLPSVRQRQELQLQPSPQSPPFSFLKAFSAAASFESLNSGPAGKYWMSSCR